MPTCRPCRPLPLAGDQRRQMSGALRMVPSPEHGTSHRMRSKRMASPWRAKAYQECCLHSLLWATQKM